MAGITVTKADLVGVLGTPLTDERFAAIHAATLRLIRTIYRGDVASATGRTAEVLDSVYTSIATRLITNPGGARTLGLGSANATFGGPDEDFANVALLTEQERADLLSLRAARRPSYVRLRAISDPDTGVTETTGV